MKFKAGLAVLAVSFSLSSLAQTELYVQDLNFVPKAGVFTYQGDVEFSSSESSYQIIDTGQIQTSEYKGSEISSTHLIGYGITDRLTGAIGFSYDFKEEMELDSLSVNGATQKDTCTTKNDGLSYLLVGGNLRFLEQNTNSINGDFRFSYATAIQDAERGRRYDSNNDGDLDSGTSGNSALPATEIELGIFLGKKLEKFEVRGGLNLLMVSEGEYKLISGNSNSDLKINQDTYAAIQYLLEGQIALNEQFILYGKLSAIYISDIKSDYRDNNGDKVEVKDRATSLGSIALGAKISLIQNKFYVFGEISATTREDQKSETKTNGVKDYISEYTKDSTSSSITLGLLAAF